MPGGGGGGRGGGGRGMRISTWIPVHGYLFETPFKITAAHWTISNHKLSDQMAE